MVRKLIERRKRGFFGWIMLTVFWLANGLMGLWLAGTINEWSKISAPTTEAAKAGTAIGVGLGLSFLLGLWFFVAVITGLFAYMTRGRKEITEVESV